MTAAMPLLGLLAVLVWAAGALFPQGLLKPIAPVSLMSGSRLTGGLCLAIVYFFFFLRCWASNPGLQCWASPPP